MTDIPSIKELSKYLVGTEYEYLYSTTVGPEDGAPKRETKYHFKHAVALSYREALDIIGTALIKLASN